MSGTLTLGRQQQCTGLFLSLCFPPPPSRAAQQGSRGLWLRVAPAKWAFQASHSSARPQWRPLGEGTSLGQGSHCGQGTVLCSVPCKRHTLWGRDGRTLFSPSLYQLLCTFPQGFTNCYQQKHWGGPLPPYMSPVTQWTSGPRHSTCCSWLSSSCATGLETSSTRHLESKHPTVQPAPSWRHRPKIRPKDALIC